jgi:hypothetical protein
MLRSFNRRVPRVALVLLLATLVSVPSAGRGTAGASSAFSFTNFELAEVALESPVGTVCPPPPGTPTSMSPCKNGTFEPQIRADADGTFYVASVSFNQPANPVNPVTFAWKSSDNGRHYTSLPSPNRDPLVFGEGPGIAVAPERNEAGYYNLYVVTLENADMDVSVSKDGGQTWTLNPLAATLPNNDRPWIAASGANTVCISYWNITTLNIVVNCSKDAGTTFTHVGSAIDADHAWLVRYNKIGNLVMNPASGTIYQIFAGIADPSEVDIDDQSTTGLSCSRPENMHQCHAIWIAVSTDLGQTFKDYLVYLNPDSIVSYGHQFPNVSIDRAGTLYAVFSDGFDIFYSWSSNQGQTWSTPAQVNHAPSNTSLMPWSVAGDPGKLDIVWYGTPYTKTNADGSRVPADQYPDEANWYVFFAQNRDATRGGSPFTHVQVSPTVHKGRICQGPAFNCPSDSRDLADDLGVAASPTTGLASISYTSDQYTDDPSNPPNATCTQDRDNTSACVHTSVATQLEGPGIFDAH